MSYSVPSPPGKQYMRVRSSPQCDHVLTMALGQNSNPAARLSEPSSVPNSQGSSFDDSVVSRASPRRPMSSDKSLFFVGDHSTRQITPSTLLSDPSSQERAAERLKDILRAKDDTQGQLRPDSHGSQNDKPQNLHIDGLNGEHIYAQKRTADGKVKPGDLNIPTSPASVSRSRGHSKSGSVTSKGSQIGEVGSLASNSS